MRHRKTEHVCIKNRTMSLAQEDRPLMSWLRGASVSRRKRRCIGFTVKWSSRVGERRPIDSFVQCWWAFFFYGHRGGQSPHLNFHFSYIWADPKWPWRDLQGGKPERFTWGRGNIRGCETLQPGCHGQLLVSREANTPETRLVAANLQQQGEAKTLSLVLVGF
jgi:hypothetical protein